MEHRRVRLAFPVLDIIEESTQIFHRSDDLVMGGIIAARVVFLESGKFNTVEAWDFSNEFAPTLLVIWFGSDDLEAYGLLCNRNLQRTLASDVLSMRMTTERVEMVERAKKRKQPYDAESMGMIDKHATSGENRLHLLG